MKNLAFCGLGQMGAPMASRLIDAGYSLNVWNRTGSKAGALVERGAAHAETPAEAARGVDAAITMLADPRALEEVVFGTDGLSAGLPPGAILVEMSTVGPDAVRAVAARLPDGVEMLDAPVRGSVPQATDGELQILVGGSEDVYHRCREILATFGQASHVGPLGSGAAMKLVANLTLGIAITGLGEALALGDALGLPQDKVLDMLEETPLGRMVQGARPRIERGDFPARFKLALAEKDLGLVTDAAEGAGLSPGVARATRDWFRRAMDAGLGGVDYSAVTAHIRGRPLRD